ncbi:Transcription factor tau [Yarrowia sp. B02]|nr:Transcription factor tau [Yarrowia sp. B02]
MNYDDLRDQFSDYEEDDDFEVPQEKDESDGDELGDLDDLEALPKRLQEIVGGGIKKKKGRGRVSIVDREPAPEVKMYLAQASECYINKQLDKAIELLGRAVQLDPKAYQAFKLLVTIYDELGDADRALTANLAAAILNHRAKEDWLAAAERSHALGGPRLLDQAIYCYSKVLQVDSSDESALTERAGLYMDKDMWRKAEVDLKRLLEMQPGDEAVVRTLGYVFTRQGRESDAIELYEGILQERLEARSEGEVIQPFTFTQLNYLLDMYVRTESWGKVLIKGKAVARWLLGRGDETFWDEHALESDAEFDERRKTVKKGVKNDSELYSLPVEIRSHICIARLKLGDANSVQEARHHLDVFLEEDSSVFADIFLTLGQAFLDANLYAEALDLLTPLVRHDADVVSQTDLYLALASALHHLGHYEDAEQAYLTVSNIDPNNVDAMLGLAESYHFQERYDECTSIVDEIRDLRAKQKREELEVEEDDEGGVVFVQRQRPSTKPSVKEKELLERKATEATKEKFAALDRQRAGLLSGNAVSVYEWMTIASELVDSFSSVRQFYPSDKRRAFKGMTLSKKRKDRMDVDHRIEMLTARLEEDVIDESENLTEFREIPFSVWFDMFMEYALALARYEDTPADCYTVLNYAKEANVFRMNSDRVECMDLVHVACSIIANDYRIANEETKTLMRTLKFYNDTIRLFSAVLPSGSDAQAVFNSTNNQKFILRYIKAVDSIILGKEITGQMRVENRAEFSDVLHKENPLLLTLYGHAMILGRSYVSALTYLMRALKQSPQDPMVLFTIAIAHVHRAIQRQTNNRHLQIVEGLSFLTQYMDIRENSGDHESQEGNFNMARMAHMLGLTGLAVENYNKVLEFEGLDERYDLKREAAYNLQLIYTISGNGKLARWVVDKYLTV